MPRHLVAILGMGDCLVAQAAGGFRKMLIFNTLANGRFHLDPAVFDNYEQKWPSLVITILT